MSTTPLKLITRALRDVGAGAAGETPAPEDIQDCFDTLNDMLDSWSNESLMVYAVQEVIHELTANQYIYTIGPGGQVGCSFTGFISGNVLTVTAISSGALSVGQILSGTNITGLVSITSLGTGVGGNTTAALGTYFLNTSATISSQAFTSAPPRPIRVNSAFVRVNNSITGTLDFPVQVISANDYIKIGIKSLPGPWPRAVYYQPTEPVGVLTYWQNPSMGEMHLMCDTILNQFNTVDDVVTFPQGMNMAIRWNLAELLMPEYGKNDSTMAQMIMKNAATFKGIVKSANKRPQQIQRFDPAMVVGNPTDAGWILSGGFAP
jgi:hypothetical protein